MILITKLIYLYEMISLWIYNVHLLIQLILNLKDSLILVLLLASNFLLYHPILNLNMVLLLILHPPLFLVIIQSSMSSLLHLSTFTKTLSMVVIFSISATKFFTIINLFMIVFMVLSLSHLVLFDSFFYYIIWIFNYFLLIKFITFLLNLFN